MLYIYFLVHIFFYYKTNMLYYETKEESDIKEMIQNRNLPHRNLLAPH